MPRRTWEAKTKAMMVLAGLKGQPVAERCTAHQQRQAQDDPWRDQCLAHVANAVAVHEQRQRAARRAREHATLKPRVGELTRECSQSAAGRGGAGSRLPWCPSVLKTAGRASGRSRPRSRSGALGAAGPPGTASRSGPSTRPRQQDADAAAEARASPAGAADPRRKALRTPTGRQPQSPRPHAWWGLEMTQGPVEGLGWMSIVVGREW